jgi:lipopolysaccharide transport system ATP-binding protein
MSSEDVMIRAEGLSKNYLIRHSVTDHITIAELALHRLRHPLTRQTAELFPALKDVSFEVHRGEVLGLIGRNGAGKSTLLKILTRITEPTTGRVDLWGQVGSLLEVGTGFHPELTGRENIYLNGAILGMSRREITRQFDDIVDFARIATFLDTPVKRFSSGMYVRLAFAIAAHLRSEILLLDEVLAVGDAEFQQRCLGKVSHLTQSGRTVILVSHSPAIIESVAQRTLLLHQGRVARLGPTSDVLAFYRSLGQTVQAKPELATATRYSAELGTRVRLQSVSPLDDVDAASNGGVSVRVTARSEEHFGAAFISHSLNAVDGPKIGSGFSRSFIIDVGENIVDLWIPTSDLAPGQYSVSLAITLGDNPVNISYLDVVLDAFQFALSPRRTSNGEVYRWDPSWGSIHFPRSTVRRVSSTETSPRP